MRVALRDVGIGGAQQLGAPGDEAAQDGIDHAAGARLADDAAGVDGQVHLRFGGAPGVFHLVSGGHEQRGELRRHLGERSIEQWSDRGLQPQVPAQRAQRDRAHRRAVDAFGDGFQRDIGRAAHMAYFVDRAGGRGQRFGAGGMTRGAACARAWAGSCAEPQAVEPHRVPEVARRHGALAGALQLAHREHALAAGHVQSIVGEA